jgi:glutathione peroxidase
MSATVSDIAVKTIDGVDKKLADYTGKVLLIVNVASQCGYTPQYSGLEALNKKYSSQGLAILGFPCNDFGAQEPGTNAQIAQFCETRYGVTFEMFDKVNIKGSNKHPLYQTLTKAVEPQGDVAWNFEKFLVNKHGEVVARYKSSVAPNDSQLISDIEAELAK